MEIEVSPGAATRVLFLDLEEIEETENVRFAINTAEKHAANPIIPLGDMGAWDSFRVSTWAGTILFDEEENIFKLWYVGAASQRLSSAIGYATSADGVEWEKPDLGLYEFNGDKRNNIVFRSPTGILLIKERAPDMSGHFVINKDIEEVNPAKRYKGWAHAYDDKSGDNAYYPVYSADGLRWTFEPTPVSYPTVDPTNLLIDYSEADPEKRTKFYGNISSGGIGHRDMGFGPDILHCSPSPHNPVLEPLEHMEHTVHLSSAIRYANYYVMTYNYNLWLDYYEQKGDFERRKEDIRVPEPKTGAFVGDARLAVNRDGTGKFQRVRPYEPIIRRGEKGTWDSGFIVASQPIERGDEIYLYYSAADEAAGASPNTAMWNVPIPIRTGLAKVRRDGFTWLQSRDALTPATVTTEPVRTGSSRAVDIAVNASQLCRFRDWIEVEVLDANSGKPIPGYTRQECGKISKEGIRVPVRWNSTGRIDLAHADRFKIRFRLYGRAKLYSFSLQQR